VRGCIAASSEAWKVSLATPFIAPTDVKLSDLDVVQPDILVVCDPTRITPT